MPSAFQVAAATADDCYRKVDWRVVIAVSHSRSVHENRMIQQRTISVLRILQLLDEMRVDGHVIRIDLRVLLDQMRLILMVRYRVMPFRHADPRIRAVARLARDLHAAHTSDVALIGQVQQVHEQLHVLIEFLRNPGGLVDRRKRRLGIILFRLLDARLDLAYGVEILIYHSPVTNTKTLPPSPNKRSKTTRGSRSCGSGVLAVRHDVQLRYEQL